MMLILGTEDVDEGTYRARRFTQVQTLLLLALRVLRDYPCATRVANGIAYVLDMFHIRQISVTLHVALSPAT